MGTAGPLALARDILDDGTGAPFFVLNRCLPLLAGLQHVTQSLHFCFFTLMLYAPHTKTAQTVQ